MLNNLAAGKGEKKKKAMECVKLVSEATGQTFQSAIADLVVKGFEAEPKYAPLHERLEGALGEGAVK